MGVSFERNTALQNLDFASLHLYAEAWEMSPAAGNAWIRDHLRQAARAGKPMVLGEFGAREGRARKLKQWLTTALRGGAAGALVWQLLNRHREDVEGYGIHCEDSACWKVLRDMAALYAEATPPGASATHGG
jgi:endo-1,4-beta-mannosidase